MLGDPDDDTGVDAVALLGDQTRRRVYQLVASTDGLVSRDDVAAALGISRELAAFHLDRLVAGGLLEAEFRRRTGRSGPGAGRPAKLYHRSAREIAVSLPDRRYGMLAEVFAEALGELDGGGAVSRVARAQGAGIGIEARTDVDPAGQHLKATLVETLGRAGYEPEVDPADGTVRLRNCPYHALAVSHRDLTCGMNLAWAEGVLDGLGAASLMAELAPTPGHCCVVFTDPSAPKE